MKLSIDTAADSKEDIRKAIRLLQALVEHDASQGSKNLFDSPSADLFGSTPEQPVVPSQNAAAAFGSLFNDDKPVPAEKEGDESVPQIELY